MKISLKKVTIFTSLLAGVLLAACATAAIYYLSQEIASLEKENQELIDELASTHLTLKKAEDYNQDMVAVNEEYKEELVSLHSHLDQISKQLEDHAIQLQP